MFRAALTVTLMLGCLVPVSAADLIDGEELLDPTRPLVRPTAAVTEDGNDFMDRFSNILPTSFELSFVRANGSSPMAIINDRRVTIGDVIAGAEVISIDRNGVTLLIDDEETRISIYGSGVKAAAQTR